MFDEARERIFSTFVTEFGAAFPAVPVFFENQATDQPAGSPWVYVTLMPNHSERANIGDTKHFYHYGVVNVACMVPENTGTKTLLQMMDKAFTILGERQWSLPTGQLTTCNAERRTRGLVNGQYTMNLLVELRQDSALIRD